MNPHFEYLIMAKNKKTGTTVMLRPRTQAAFHRSRRDKAGNVIETHVFQSLQPFAVTDEWIDALYDDIGKALVIVNVSEEDGRPRVDWDATAAVIAERDGVQVETKPQVLSTPEPINVGGGVTEKSDKSGLK